MGVVNKQSNHLIIMKTVLMFTCLVLAVSAQQRGGLQCSDGNKPTCTCDNGTVVTRPRFNPCGDRTKPTCVCADGSSPQRKPACADGSRPTCANGVAPVCRDGSLPIHQPFLPALMVCPGVRTEEEYLVLMEPAS